MKKATYIFWILITALPILGLFFSLSDPKEFLNVQEVWRQRIAVFGAFGPIVFVLFQALQVIIAPISHYTVGAIGGFLYGPFLGGFLNWIGRVIGHIIAFFIARIWGRQVVEKFVNKKDIDKFDKLVSGSREASPQSIILFLIYFLPLFPDDEISYIVGLSKMKKRVFILANAFGHVGGALSLAYLGSGIDTKDPYFWILFLSTLAGFPIIWLIIRRRLNNNSYNQLDD